ncbi:MAG: 16S rRNA processing protein RimM [Clostridia bacterium]|nr:16S rRNA processing protein RimM [Clostridia bacterium]
MKREYLEAGRICSAHGVRGGLKIEHMCDSASVLAKQKRIFLLSRGEYVERAVRTASPSGKFVIMTIEGVESREDAIALRGRDVYLHRSDVPVMRGAMLIVDMIGLPVIHAESGARLGTLSDVSDVAGRRIYTVSTESGEVLLPDVPEFIKEIDEERGIRVLPIPGLFDDDYEI